MKLRGVSLNSDAMEAVRGRAPFSGARKKRRENVVSEDPGRRCHAAAAAASSLHLFCYWGIRGTQH